MLSQSHLVEEERVGEVFHVRCYGQLSLQAEVELSQASLHLMGQSVHPLTLLGGLVGVWQIIEFTWKQTMT